MKQARKIWRDSILDPTIAARQDDDNLTEIEREGEEPLQRRSGKKTADFFFVFLLKKSFCKRTKLTNNALAVHDPCRKALCWT